MKTTTQIGRTRTLGPFPQRLHATIGKEVGPTSRSPEIDPDRPRSWGPIHVDIFVPESTQTSVKMGNLVADYQKARSLLRLGPYDAWLVECIVNLLMRHDNRVAAEKRLRVGRRTSKAMLARQDAGRRVSSIPPYGWTTDPVRPWRLTPQPEEQEVRQRILREAAAGKTFRAIARGLDAAGVPSRAGRTWSHQTVGAIVRRAAHKR